MRKERSKSVDQIVHSLVTPIYCRGAKGRCDDGVTRQAGLTMMSQKFRFPLASNLGLSFLALSSIFGCTTYKPPELTLEPNASLGHYQRLAIAPVTASPDQSLDPKVLQDLQVDLMADLKNKGYAVDDYGSASAGSLVVQCSYVSYRPGSMAEALVPFVAQTALLAVAGGPSLPPTKLGDAHATVSVQLLDRNTGAPLAEMVAIQEQSGLAGDAAVPLAIAAEIADAIDNKIRGA